MSDVPMPRGLSEAELEMRLQTEYYRELLREAVREAVLLTIQKSNDAGMRWTPMVLPLLRDVLSCVMGDEPEGGADAR